MINVDIEKLRRRFGQNQENIVIAIDFDGTIVKETPHADDLIPVPYAIETIRRLQACNVRWILWTMRSDKQNWLKEALGFLQEHNLKPWGINRNPEQSWSSSPKAYANIYIDNAAFGCPLIKEDMTGHEYVNWKVISDNLFLEGEAQS